MWNGQCAYTHNTAALTPDDSMSGNGGDAGGVPYDNVRLLWPLPD